MTTGNHRSEVGFLNCRRPAGPVLSGIRRCPLHTGFHLVSQRPILAHGVVNDLSSVLTGSVLTDHCSIVSDSKIALSRSSSPICSKLVMACSASSEMRPFRNNAPQLIAELNISDITAVLPSHKTATRQG